MTNATLVRIGLQPLFAQHLLSLTSIQGLNFHPVLKV
jgi:hypothetical protein